MDINLLTEDLDETTFPDKFKDPETGALRVQALVNSYSELEKKLSSGPAAPKSHEEYCINCEHGMFEPDEEVNKRLHAKGFSTEQAQEVYDLAAEKMMPLMAEMAAEFQADREVEKLVGHFGGPEKWKEVSRQLLAFGKKNLPADVLGNLSSSYEGVLGLYKMMKGEEPTLNPKASPVEGVSESDLGAMMRDPRYWRDKDPAFVKKVTEGFKNLYGDS